MKTEKAKKMPLFRLGLVLAIFMSLSFKSKAQTYSIVNNLNCDVWVQWTAFDSNCSTSCQKGGGTIANNGAMAISLGSCPTNYCNIRVKLISIQGTSLSTPGQVDLNAPNDSGSSQSACNTWLLSWSTNHTVISQ